MKKEFWIISLKNLRKRGLRSYLTLLGILIGVMAVVALIGLGNGLKAAVNAQFGISSTEVISVQAGGLSGFGPPGTGVDTPLTLDDAKAIGKLSNVEEAIPRVVQSGKLEYNNIQIIGFATNIPSGDQRDLVYEIINVETEKGKLLDDSDEDKVILGHNFYVDKVGLGKPIDVGDEVLIQDKKFTVKGILEKKGSFIFDNIVLMNQDAVYNLFDIDEDVDIIAVKVDDREKILDTKEDIEELLRKRRNVKEGEEDFEVSTPQAALETVNSVLLSVQIFIVIIAMISVFIGAIGIINTMTTSVVERRKEIGVMKAIGAKNSHIFYLFFIEAGLLGLMGGLIGAILGSGISAAGTVGLNNWLGTQLIPNFDFILVGLTLFGSFIVGAVSGIWPAMKAAKQNPVEALRG